MKIFYYGNCQLAALSKYIDSIYKHEIKIFYVLKNVSEIEKLENWLMDCDVFIYQNVKSDALIGNNVENFTSDNLIKKFKFNKTICVPSIYFSGYFPEPISLQFPIFKNNNKLLELLPNYTIGYKMWAILNLQLKSVDIFSIISKDDFIHNQVLKDNFINSLYELRIREKNNNVDIIVSDFIEFNYHKSRLFHTTNHPSKYLFIFIVNEILKLLKLEDLIQDNFDFDVMETEKKIFILPCVKKFFQLEHISFHDDTCFIKQKQFTPIEYIESIIKNL